MNNLEIKGRLFEVSGEIDLASKSLASAIERIKADAQVLKWTGGGFDLLNLSKQFREMERNCHGGAGAFEQLKDLIKEKASLERRILEKGI